MAPTKIHKRQLIISSYSQIESCTVNISSTANTTYYLNLCNINNYFNNFNTKLTFELNFLRSSGVAEDNIINFEITKEGTNWAESGTSIYGNKYIINQLGSNAFFTRSCILNFSIIIDTSHNVWMKFTTAANQIAFNLFIKYISNSKNKLLQYCDLTSTPVVYTEFPSTFVAENFVTTAPTSIARQLDFIDGCIINSEVQRIRIPSLSFIPNILTTTYKISNLATAINTAIHPNYTSKIYSVVQIPISADTVGTYDLNLRNISAAPIGTPIIVILQLVGSNDAALSITTVQNGTQTITYKHNLIHMSSDHGYLKFSFIKTSSNNIHLLSAFIYDSD